MFAVGLSYMAFIKLRYVPSMPAFWRVFYHKLMLNFVKGFLYIYWDNHMAFIFQFFNVVYYIDSLGFPGGSEVKVSACNAGDLVSIPGLGISPGEAIGYPLQYSWASLVPQTVNTICFIDFTRALTVWIVTNCGKLLKRWEYQTILPIFWETCMQVKN